MKNIVFLYPTNVYRSIIILGAEGISVTSWGRSLPSCNWHYGVCVCMRVYEGREVGQEAAGGPFAGCYRPRKGVQLPPSDLYPHKPSHKHSWVWGSEGVSLLFLRAVLSRHCHVLAYREQAICLACGWKGRFQGLPTGTGPVSLEPSHSSSAYGKFCFGGTSASWSPCGLQGAS